MYDAYGNFAYGATGAAAGFPCKVLTWMGDMDHGGRNYEVNTADIMSGYNVGASGGRVTAIEYMPPAR